VRIGLSIRSSWHKSRAGRNARNAAWPWSMLVISVAIIFFQLGKTIHPTFSPQKSHREVRLASPVFPVPQLKKYPKVSRDRKAVATKKTKAKSKGHVAKKFRKQRRALSSSVGTPPKLVKE